jgi:hypothetical protein
MAHYFQFYYDLKLGFGICKLTIRCKAAPVVPLL